ncbi:MAG: hypothetical protein ACI8RZ_007736 [Myxococcota bacterium]|jgi:hypothetical protein
MEWTVQIDDKPKRLSEKKLRKKLRSRDLTGMELCRAPGSGEWVVLHSTEIFAEEVPHVGDAAMVAQRRELTGFGWHLAIFLGVMAFLGFPFWGIFWGIGVAGHAFKIIPILQTMLGQQTTAPQVQAAEPVAPQPVDAFEARLTSLLASLPDSTEDLSGIAQSARSIHAQIQQLDEALSGTSLAELEAQSGQGTEGERIARDGHITAIKSAMASRERLAGQERELLHALEHMRLTRLDSASSEDLSEQLGELRGRLDAEAEVEQKLEAARRASRQRT